MATKNGFTLIELLVVVSIIGLLSSITLASVSVANSKARDARRISDLRQIRIALEMYYNDKGEYPLKGSSTGGVYNNGSNSGAIGSWSNLRTALNPYISTLPIDPINTPNATIPFVAGYGYNYIASSDGKSYDLVTILENSNSLDCEHQQYVNHVPFYYGGSLTKAAGNVVCAGTPAYNARYYQDRP